MPRSAYKKIAVLSAPFVLIILLTLPHFIIAAGEESDTLIAETKKQGKHVRININENGISIDTGKEQGRSRKRGGGATITIGSSDREYKEKATDIVRFGEDVFVAEDELVRGDLVVFGGDVTIRGKVLGDVVVIGGDIDARSGSEINGDAVVIGGSLEEAEDVSIHGERVVVKSFLPVFTLGSLLGPRPRLASMIAVPVKFVLALILGFLVLLFMKGRIFKTRSFLEGEYLKSFGWGFIICFAAVFVIPIASFILAITIIGIPLAGLIILSWVAITIISCTVFAYDLGLRISDKMGLHLESPFAVVLVGTTVIFLPLFIGHIIQFIPLMWAAGFGIRILANIFIFLGCIVGLGALFSSKLGSKALVTPPQAPLPSEQ